MRSKSLHAGVVGLYFLVQGVGGDDSNLFILYKEGSNRIFKRVG